MGATITNIATRHEYDHMGRKKVTMESINGQGEVVLSKLDYNEVGQLTKKSLHSTDGTAFLQNNKYGYNERGWLKRQISAEFSVRLGYDTLAAPQYNGNIATQEWGTSNSFPNKFTYSYDKLNRLTNGTSTGVVMSEVLTYDVMGNILSLTRGGSAQNYTYIGNRLRKVTGGASRGYTYDLNGNALKDTLNTFTYNSLNLPATVNRVSPALSLSYVYDATGRKLRKVSNGTARDYIDGIEYNGNTIDIIHTEEGIARNSAGTYNYEYNLCDHLGNVRYGFKKNVSNWAVDELQRIDYYPFGKTSVVNAGTNKYLYSGKELQDELGQLDYGARFYDPVIARWQVIDPLAEMYQSGSPYTYVMNNPLKYNDPTGMFSTHTDEDGNVVAVYEDGDKGVYKHDGNRRETSKELKESYSKKNTSGGGEKMGESLHSLSFANQSLYNASGKVEAADIKIDFGSDELTDKVQSIINARPSVKEYAGNAGSDGVWDLKTKISNGSLLYGKYASPRDAGNFAAGAVAQMSGIEPVVQFGYGAYNISNNNKPLTGILTMTIGAVMVYTPIIGLPSGYLISKYGEDKLTQRSIDIGKQYIKRR